ncbi:MAG: hypothetical protein EOO73_13425 [Myxococcales bacterium]|nr:MAG: hypothetical protein EOO73_13425 [Myxococcales bacterium]
MRLWLGALVLSSCSAFRGARWPAPAPEPAPAPGLAASATAALEPSTAQEPRPQCGDIPQPIGRIRSRELDEISGVAESRADPRVLFVHNDSGDTPRFFAIDRSGELLAELTLEDVPILLDAEDIALGPGPGRASFIYLGDTGNNFATGLGLPRRKAFVYRFPEPPIQASAHGAKLSVERAFRITLTFPRGARNVEAFFIDPRTGDLIALAKQPDGVSEVLMAPAALLAAGGGELLLLGELRFGKPPLSGSPMPTSASITQDGSAILVRTYSSIFLFERGPSATIMEALARPPRVLPSPPEGQGEAISFVDGDAAYVTISEGADRSIYCAQLPAPQSNSP